MRIVLKNPEKDDVIGMKQKRCLKCPYHLEYVKCIKDPCPDCGYNGKDKHPFPEPKIIREHLKKNSFLNSKRRKNRGNEI